MYWAIAMTAWDPGDEFTTIQQPIRILLTFPRANQRSECRRWRSMWGETKLSLLQHDHGESTRNGEKKIWRGTVILQIRCMGTFWVQCGVWWQREKDSQQAKHCVQALLYYDRLLHRKNIQHVEPLAPSSPGCNSKWSSTESWFVAENTTIHCCSISATICLQFRKTKK